MKNTYTQEELKAALQDALNDNNQEAAAELADRILELEGKTYIPTNMPPMDILEELGQGFKGAADTAQTALRKNMAEQLSGEVLPRTALVRAGVEGLLPAGGEVISSVLQAGKRSIGTLMPDGIEKAVGQKALDTFIAAGDLVATSENARKALKLASESWSGFQAWKNSSPENAELGRTLGNLFDVSLMAVAPSKVSPILPLDTLDTASRKLSIVGKNQSKIERKKTVARLLDPEPLESGKGKVTTEGLLQTKTYNPTSYDVEVIETINNIKDFKPTGSFTNNARTIETAIERTRKELDGRIRSKGNPSVDISEIEKKLNQRLTTLIDSPQFVVSQAVPAQAKAFAETALDFLKKSDGTALGLLNVRRDLDAWAKANAPGSFSPEFENTKRKIFSEIRTLINEEVGAVVPDVNVLGLLKKQREMYSGLDIIDFKAKKEASNLLGRQLGNIERTLGIRFPTTPAAQMATGMMGVSAITAGVGPYIATAGGVGITGALLTKYLKGPTAKENLSFIMRKTSEAIRRTENSAMVEQLKADRLLLIDYFNTVKDQPLTEEEEKEGPLLLEQLYLGMDVPSEDTIPK
jgi:hypothetical protein